MLKKNEMPFAETCIQDACHYAMVGGFDGLRYFIDGVREPLTPEEVDALRQRGYEIFDDIGDWIAIPQNDLEDVVGAKAYGANVKYDSEYEKYLLESCLKPAPYYLLYGECLTWDKRDGGDVVGDLSEALYRGYEVTDTIVRYDGRTLELCESSHDVPMGAPFYVIGISERTKRAIDNGGYDALKRCVDRAVERLNAGKEEKK